MVNKLEKVKTVPKLNSQQQMRPTHQKKEPILMRRLNMQEGHTSKMALDTRVVTSTTQE
jgi:hypothetical protein